MVAQLLALCVLLSSSISCVDAAPKNLVVDTDLDTDDVFALLFILKQNRSEINLKAVTINSNSWANAASAANTVYNVLYMLGREDVAVGVGGEGGILPDGTIQPDVGGYLPIIDQGETTAGGCRYRQAVPPGAGGSLDVDTNYGLRRQFLPQSRKRWYRPGEQPTAQTVLLSSLSSGTNTLLTLGGLTNIATLLQTHSQVKEHIDHIYVMGGAVKSSNPAGCCPANDTTCVPRPSCGSVGNLFDAVDTNPFAEFNMFMDPFAAYQVFHSGLPLTLVALDATNTITLSEQFFNVFGRSENQRTFEAQYCFQTLKILRDTWFDDTFYTSLFVWDSFASGVTISGMRNNHDYTKNEFAEIFPKKVTVVTSNKPYGAHDGSNPFFARGRVPPFNIKDGGIHSGHVQTGMQDPFCLANSSNGRGVCQDGYTKETDGPDGVNIFLATRAKPNQDPGSPLDREFYRKYIAALNDPHQTASFNFQTEFKHKKDVLYSPDLKGLTLGRTVVFDMDMSPGDFITLFYLLKTPVGILNLKAITTVGNGWANPATIDLVYDVLHMMGRDDVAVGAGAFFALNQSYPPFNAEGGCKYYKAIPNGGGGQIDSDSLFGLNYQLPRSPRLYTAQNSVKFGAPRNTEFPELRQRLAGEVLAEVFRNFSKVTIVTGGPLTNIATFLQSNASYKYQIEEMYTTGGAINRKGNVFTVPENHVSEFNFFLDPIAAQYVIESAGIENLTLIPLDSSSRVPLTAKFVHKLNQQAKTAEAKFMGKLLATIYRLRGSGEVYHFQSRNVLGEVLAATILSDSSLVKKWETATIAVTSTGDIAVDGQTHFAPTSGSRLQLRYAREVVREPFLEKLLAQLNEPTQTAVVGSFEDQIKQWS